MGKRILGIIAAVVVVYLLYVGYVRYRDRLNESGDIRNDDLSHGSSESAETVEKPVQRTPVQPAPQPVQQQTVSAPASDSIAPNPSNGMTFAGTGKFQVYRQGNLTWRVDTDSGRACILFATMEEWRKPIVYQHGCNNS